MRDFLITAGLIVFAGVLFYAALLVRASRSRER